jgi:hypothetical protein
MHATLLTLLSIAILGPMLLNARPADSRPASQAEIKAFMDKWRPVLKDQGFAGFVSLSQETNAEALVLAAIEREPEGLWCWALQMIHPPRFTIPEQARHACRAWKQAHAAVAGAAQKAPVREEVRQSLRMIEENLATTALAVGEDLALVRQMADRLLLHAGQNPTNWDHGNLIYTGHSLLGRVALRQGKVEEARKQLRQAGQTPGSPQLNSFGPQFDLARELLKHGEPADRDAVIAFLDDVARFCANPDKETYAPYRQSKIKSRQQIEAWKQDIRAGKIPTDRQWQ